MHTITGKEIECKSQIRRLQVFFAAFNCTHKCILYARVSDYYPHWRQLQESQFMEMRRVCRQCGIEIVDEFKEVEKRNKWKQHSRPQLSKAYHLATSHKCPIIACDVTRLMGYKDKERLPSKKLRIKFQQEYPKAMFICLNDDVKRSRRLRGHVRCESRKMRKQRLLPIVLEEFGNGKSYRQIATPLKIAHSVVRDWMKELGVG